MYRNIHGQPERRGDSFQVTITSADASSATQVKAGEAEKSIYITDLIISTDTATDIQLQDDAGSPNVLVEGMYFPANSILPMNFLTPLKVATGNDLDVIAGAAGNISVTAIGYIK